MEGCMPTRLLAVVDVARLNCGDSVQILSFALVSEFREHPTSF
jgi:hypothetical protein